MSIQTGVKLKNRFVPIGLSHQERAMCVCLSGGHYDESLIYYCSKW